MKTQTPPPKALSKETYKGESVYETPLRAVAALCLVTTSIGFIAREMGSPP